MSQVFPALSETGPFLKRRGLLYMMPVTCFIVRMPKAAHFLCLQRRKDLKEVTSTATISSQIDKGIKRLGLFFMQEG